MRPSGLTLLVASVPLAMAPPAQMPGAIVKPSAQQTVQNQGAIVWGTVVSDPNSMWSSSNPTRLTVTASSGAGRYVVSVSFQGATAGQSGILQIFKNGASPSSTPLGAHTFTPWNSGTKPAETLEVLDQAIVGDYYEVRIVNAVLPPNGVQVDPVTRFALQRVD